MNIWGGDAVCKKKGLKMKGIDLYMKVYNQKKRNNQVVVKI